MSLPSDDELKARRCLAVGSWLIDPKHLGPGAEDRLKERCRECWALRKHFPGWVLAYVSQWAADGKPAMSRDEEDAA